MVYCCEKCGQIFEVEAYNAKYCEICRIQMRRKRQRIWDSTRRQALREERAEEGKRKHPKPKESIESKVKKAQVLGLSYGEYVARYG